ncbi:sugar ABC transporter, periplasmic sugar-binding protein [Lachnospiraceae bacterium KM106-2]|nr:sugar ABC transporter, periplasmic sugar-binding protein [Lachnospiraceae bacterium KM106-2]
MKKKLCFLILSFLVLGTACGNQSTKKEIHTPTARKPILIWSYYETPEQQQSLNRLITDFNMAQTQYHASWEYVPMTEFTKRLSIGVTEDALPDVVIIDNPDTMEYVKLGLFKDITDYVEKLNRGNEYYEEVLKSVRVKQRYYGVPFCTNNLALIYNKDMFQKAGLAVPKTWDDFLIACRKLTKGKCQGFAMSAISGEQGAFQTLPWVLSNDKGAITKESLTTGYERMEELVSKGYMSEDCINWSQNDVARKFISQEAAMMENGSWVLPMVKNSGIHYGIATLPLGEKKLSIVGGENLCIIKKKRDSGAIRLLEYYNQNEVMDQICEDSYVLPPKKDQASVCAKKMADYEVFVRQMDHAVSRVSITNWSDLSELLSDETYRILTGKGHGKEVGNTIMNRWK